MSTTSRHSRPFAQQDDGAQQQHDQLRGEDEHEGEQRQDHERDARLREHRREVRDRQRLPEQDAAIAALAVQRVEAVEHADEEGGER